MSSGAPDRRSNNAANSFGSRSETTQPPLPITSGIAPLKMSITGTPQLCDSMIALPNCSRHMLPVCEEDELQALLDRFS